jgi:hypothetical protein
MASLLQIENDKSVEIEIEIVIKIEIEIETEIVEIGIGKGIVVIEIETEDIDHEVENVGNVHVHEVKNGDLEIAKEVVHPKEVVIPGDEMRLCIGMYHHQDLSILLLYRYTIKNILGYI